MRNKIVIGLFVSFLIIQFFQPIANDFDSQTNDVSTKFNVPENVAHILKIACNDCHSNKTEYPWYSKIQPIAWWLDKHINEGKRHLNFSTMTGIRVAFQNHKFEEIIEQIENKEMPFGAYTYLGMHKEANLSDAQRQTLITWAKTNIDSLKLWYPADSLKMPARK